MFYSQMVRNFTNWKTQGVELKVKQQLDKTQITNNRAVEDGENHPVKIQSHTRTMAKRAERIRYIVTVVLNRS